MWLSASIMCPVLDVVLEADDDFGVQFLDQ